MIRIANENDAGALLGIYSYYIENTAITFECDVPTVEEFACRIKETLKRYPYFVFEDDGEILGYAYAGALVKRAAADHSVEVSIYIKNGCQKSGYGRKLYEALEIALRQQNIINVYALIAYTDTEDEHLTHNSVEYHSHLGYREVGKLCRCGYKFGKWYNLVWME